LRTPNRCSDRRDQDGALFGSRSGIGPTHSDITAACVAKAFGVPIDADPRALAILHEWLNATGTEMNEARLRMTLIPKGADLIHNKVSGSPGFWIGNVIVMAGVPSIMQAMLDEVAPKLKIGVRMLSETVRADARAGDIGMQLGEIANANPTVTIGSYPFFDPQGPTRMWCCAAAMHRNSRLQNARSRTCWSECGKHNRIAPEHCQREPPKTTAPRQVDRPNLVD
jgi:molybdopterin-biosynthesis enzyme MoeA-like protein